MDANDARYLVQDMTTHFCNADLVVVVVGIIVWLSQQSQQCVAGHVGVECVCVLFWGWWSINGPVVHIN